MYQKFKKYFLFVGIVFFSAIMSVNARILTIDEVVEQFNDTSLVKYLQEHDSDINCVVNSEGNTLDIYSDNEKISSFTFGNDYIEYDNRDSVITEETIDDNFMALLWITSIVESVFTLSGYDDKTIADNFPKENTFDQYGLEINGEDYDFETLANREH